MTVHLYVVLAHSASSSCLFKVPSPSGDLGVAHRPAKIGIQAKVTKPEALQAIGGSQWPLVASG